MHHGLGCLLHKLVGEGAHMVGGGCLNLGEGGVDDIEAIDEALHRGVGHLQGCCRARHLGLIGRKEGGDLVQHRLAAFL